MLDGYAFSDAIEQFCEDHNDSEILSITKINTTE